MLRSRSFCSPVVAAAPVACHWRRRNPVCQVSDDLQYVDASFLTNGDSGVHTGFAWPSATLVSSTRSRPSSNSWQYQVKVLYLINLSDEMQRPISLHAVVMEDQQADGTALQLSVIEEKIETLLDADNIADVLTKALP